MAKSLHQHRLERLASLKELRQLELASEQPSANYISDLDETISIVEKQCASGLGVDFVILKW